MDGIESVYVCPVCGDEEEYRFPCCEAVAEQRWFCPACAAALPSEYEARACCADTPPLSAEELEAAGQQRLFP